MQLPARLVLMVASAALSLALAEGALRLRERESEPWACIPSGAPLRELHDVLELGAPNALGLYKGQVHRTNRHGFRGPEPSPEKPHGTFRIAVIGDSITMGEGVADDQTYAARLERMLDRTDGARFEVINLGLSGLNLRHSLSGRLPIGLRFDPDLLIYGFLIYGFTINDLEELPGYRVTRHAAFPETSWRLLSLARQAWIRIGERLARPGSYRAELEGNYFDNAAVWSEFEADLAQLASIGRERGVWVEVLLHAHLADTRDWLLPIYERVERAARRQGLHVVSTLPVFDGLDVASFWIDRSDPHPNAAGHALLAQALARGLASLPESCWRGAPPGWKVAEMGGSLPSRR